MGHFKSDNEVFIIAEIGGNHEGNFEYAKKLTKLAAESGVDAIKFQIYTGDSLVNSVYDPDRNKHFKKFQLPKEQYIELAQLCESYGVMFMASVWDIDAFSYIDKYMPIYKIGSGDMTAYNLIKKMVETKKPIIISTGLATQEEVTDMVEFIKQLDSEYITQKKLSILQCTSMYPIPDEDANLNVMKRYKELFDLPIGYSDHTVGVDAVEVAVSMGAEIIEIHFTDEREGKIFRDHKVSLTKNEIIDLRAKIKKIKTLQWSPKKEPTKSELEVNHPYSFRRAVYAKEFIKKGTKITEDMLITLRPECGVRASEFYNIVGKEASCDINKLEKLDEKLN